MRIVLNGFEVDARLARLMSRADWPGRRTGAAWLGRFPAHPSCEYGRLPFVQLCSVHTLTGVNATVRNPEMASLCGEPRVDDPPGDFDPAAGYVIGFTDYVDSAVCVDLRPEAGPRIIYETLGRHAIVYATAFDSIASFVRFYIEQHGEA